MSGSVLTVSPPTISSEVHRFAAERGLSQHLTPLIELARQAFPTATLMLSLGQDAEDATHRYVAIDVAADGLDTEELLAGQQSWSRGVSETCPSAAAVYFVLGWR